MGRFPSGQRGQTVNLLQIASVVRIHLHPLLIRYILETIAYNIIRISNLVLRDLLFENETYINFVHKIIGKYTFKI